MWLELKDAGQIFRCDSDRCKNQPAWSLEGDGAVTNYCNGCKSRVARAKPRPPGPNKGKSEAEQWLRDHAWHQGSECLIWPFSLTRGYGRFVVNARGQYAHRFMCELIHGPAPTPDHEAAHSCGKGHKGCVNPCHLLWKEPIENQRDKQEHGTVYRGGKGWKLTPAQVLEIRSLKGIKTQDELARMYGVGRQNIGAILTGRSWPKVQTAK